MEPAKAQTIATDLQSLAPELVEEIIRELPLSTLLAILASENEYLGDCIVRSPSWHHLFPDENTGTQVTNLYLIWLQINKIIDVREKKSPSTTYNVPEYILTLHRKATISFFSKRYFHTLFADEISYFCRFIFRPESRNRLVRVITRPNCIRLAFPGNSLPDFKFDIISSSHAGSGSFDARKLRGEISALQKMERAFHMLKKQELERLADLFEKHPTRLKPYLDPRETTQMKTALVINRMRHGVARITRSNAFQRKRSAYSYFMTYYLYLVPRDACLHLFLHALKKHPCGLGYDPLIDIWLSGKKSPQKELVGRLQELILDTEPRHEIAPPSYDYPSNILEKLKTALEGMEYLYTDYIDPASPREYYPRILHVECTSPVYAAQSEALTSLPTFATPQKRDVIRHVFAEAHDVREIEWLEAFLECCEFFENTFPDIAKETANLTIPKKISPLITRPKNRGKNKNKKTSS